MPVIDQLLDQVRELRDDQQEKLDGIVNKASAERRSLTAAEQRRFDQLEQDIRDTDDRLDELRDQKTRSEAADEIRKKYPDIRVGREPHTYDEFSKLSFFGDVFRASKGNLSAMERLRRHDEEQRKELEHREARAEVEREKLNAELRAFGAQIEYERRDVTRTDTTSAGEFVPPLWLIDRYAPLARAGRACADLLTGVPLPPGTDSINIPRVTTGTLTGVQTADLAAIANQDLVTGTVTAPVRTIAGYVDVAIQLLEQSPAAFDQIVFRDLIADYNMQLDQQVINGSGASGQLQGILGLSGINSTTYTDATPTVPEIYTKVASQLNDVATTRFLGAEAIVMHPRRWYWFTAALDANNRPLVVPTGNGAFNAIAVAEGGPTAEGLAGRIMGSVPVYIDANISTNLGAGTNEDRIITAKFSDAILWESTIRTSMHPDIKSSTLEVRLRLYNYAAAAMGRFPKAFSVMSGTGLVAPVF